MKDGYRQESLVDLETMKLYSDEMREIVSNGSLVNKKTFIRGFVRDIRVTGGKAILSYSPPSLPDKVELDLEGVPPIVHHGGRYWA